MKRFLTLILPVLILVLFSVLDFCGLLPAGVPLQTLAAPEPAPTEPTVLALAPDPTEDRQPSPNDRYPWLNDTLDLSARYVFVYDCSTDTMLYSEGELSDTIAMASLTKLFTAHVALQYLDPNQIISVGEEAGWIAFDSSIACIRPGNVVSVDMLIEGLLLQSGNDAAYALAVAAGRAMAPNRYLTAAQALNLFMEEMNAQAQALGMTGTQFINPDGYDAEGHCSTPEDLLIMARMAVEHPSIRRYTSMYQHHIYFYSGEDYEWKNTNALVDPESEYYIPEAFGLKTGYTSTAGACLISAFQVDGRTMIIGVLGCPTVEDRFAETVYLFKTFCDRSPDPLYFPIMQP